MSISPRKNEVEAVTAILESDEFEDSVAMSKAIVKAVAAELQSRDGYGVAIGLRSDDLRIPHGMFYTIMDAKRTVKEAEARGLVAFVAPLLGAANALTEESDPTAKRCVCGHPKELHGVSIKPKAATSLGCCVYRSKVKCPCGTYDAA